MSQALTGKTFGCFQQINKKKLSRLSIKTKKEKYTNMVQKLNPEELRRVKTSNAWIGWVLLAAVVIFALFYGVLAAPTRQLIGGGDSGFSTMAGSVYEDVGPYGTSSPLGMSGDVYENPTYGSVVGSDGTMFVPNCGLNKKKPLCMQPPLQGMCGSSLYGASLGDQTLFVGSYLPAVIYNSSGFATNCGEIPSACDCS